MIELLRAARGANFYVRTTRITKKSIQALFDSILSVSLEPSRPIFRVERKKSVDVHYSVLCFSYNRPVPFLAEVSRKFDKVHGFLLLVEKGSTVALLRSGLDATAAFKKDFLGPLDRSHVERAIARHDATFEKLSLRNMTGSRFALRSKTMEARDLDSVIAASSAGRYIPQYYRVRRGGDTYSATPSTGRIAIRADRADLGAAISWAAEIVDLLADDTAAASAFIGRFARPVRLDQIAPGVAPTFFAVDTLGLADAIWEAEERIRLVREDRGAWRELGKGDIEAILADLEDPFEVIAGKRALGFALRRAGKAVGDIRLNKTRIALRKLDVASVADVFIESAKLALGTDPDRRLLARHIDAKDMFTVLFDDLALAYIDGSLFMDEALVGGGDTFMRHLIAEPGLMSVTSEKGTFAAGQTEFSTTSVFRVVVDRVSTENVLVCDDLGDEWADFIGVADGRLPMITFYHAKHGDLGMSASAFHEAVGQAIKNLGRFGLSGDAIKAKHRRWNNFYRNEKKTTAIRRRIRGGTRHEVSVKLDEVAAAPDLQCRVLIVTSSLSRAAVQTAFSNARLGKALQPSFVQLYWLLTGFFSACAEIGTVGFVVCQP